MRLVAKAKEIYKTLPPRISTTPVDRERLTKAYCEIYLYAGLPCPKVRWFDSPYQATQDNGLSEWGAPGPEFGSWTTRSEQVIAELFARGEEKIWVKACKETFLGHIWYTSYDTVFASDNPVNVSLDENGRLHDEERLALEYADGSGFASWHGTTIPREWILERDKLDARAALHWPNIEQRRILAEIIGWDKIIAELKPTIRGEDEFGQLMVARFPDAIRDEQFVKVKCGTGRTFVIPVPLEMETALEAVAWTYSLSSDEYKQLEIRT